MPPSSMLSYLSSCRCQTETGVFILTGERPLGRPNRLNIDIGGAGGKSEGVLQVAPPPHRTVRRRSDTDCWTGVYFWRSGVRNRCQETNLEGESKTTSPEAETHLWETKKHVLGV